MINLPSKEQANFYLNLILSGLVLLLLAWSVQNWRTDWQLAYRSHSPSAHIAKQDETAKLIAGIPSSHLFGHAFSNTADAPLSRLQFSVTGIVKTNHKDGKQASKAYISVSGQPAKIVEVGDELPFGVKVYDITKDTVILENDGHLEKLPLPRPKLEFKPKGAIGEK